MQSGIASDASAQKDFVADLNAGKGTGCLVPLKTTLETNIRESTIHVYVTTVQVKSASNVFGYEHTILMWDYS